MVTHITCIYRSIYRSICYLSFNLDSRVSSQTLTDALLPKLFDVVILLDLISFISLFGEKFQIGKCEPIIDFITKLDLALRFLRQE